MELIRRDGALTDEEIAALAIESEAHFNALVDRYTPLVYRIALRITGVPEEAEEIVQETFLKVFSNLHEFSPSKASFKTWLMTIARNQSINTFASLKRKAARFLHDVTSERYGHGPEESLFDADQPDPEELFSTREQMARVEEALKQLPERQRTALQLKVLEHMSYEEIAGIMKTSHSSVESLIFRARQKLLELLAD